MSFHSLGTYLGKPVRCGAIASPSDLQQGSLRHQLVLLIAGREFVAQEARHLLDAIANQGPLAIMVSGEGVDGLFEQLLRSLNDGTPRPFVVSWRSYESVLEETLQQFFYAVLPAEERFSEWEGYSILSFEMPAGKIEQAVLSLLDS